MSKPDVILFLSANPVDTRPLGVDQEAAAVRAALRGAKLRSRFRFEHRCAVDVTELRRALLETQPRFVHFSGHGEPKGIMIVGPHGRSMTANGEGLAALFAATGTAIECVVLNACFSARQAKAIGKKVRYVIGMKSVVYDPDAIAFAEGFYDAIGTGQETASAYAVAVASVHIGNKKAARIPSLSTNPDLAAPKPAKAKPRGRRRAARAATAGTAAPAAGPVMVINSGSGGVAYGEGSGAGGAGSVVLGHGGVISLGRSLRAAAGALSARDRARLLRSGLSRIRSADHE
ncbi:MAG: hypothetical protein RLZZ15_4456 [Verrucomicrobiota bacterium]|jgi:hypothetical protein